MQVSLSRKLMNILCNYNILSTLKDKLASQGEFKPASVAFKHMTLVKIQQRNILFNFQPYWLDSIKMPWNFEYILNNLTRCATFSFHRHCRTQMLEPPRQHTDRVLLNITCVILRLNLGSSTKGRRKFFLDRSRFRKNYDFRR